MMDAKMLKLIPFFIPYPSLKSKQKNRHKKKNLEVLRITFIKTESKRRKKFE